MEHQTDFAAARRQEQKRALRRHYAGQAMQALITCKGIATPPKATAELAFSIAQAMVEEDERIVNNEEA